MGVVIGVLVAFALIGAVVMLVTGLGGTLLVILGILFVVACFGVVLFAIGASEMGY